MTTLDNPLPVYLAQPNHLVLHKNEMAGKFLNVGRVDILFLGDESTPQNRESLDNSYPVSQSERISCDSASFFFELLNQIALLVSVAVIAIRGLAMRSGRDHSNLSMMRNGVQKRL